MLIVLKDMHTHEGVMMKEIPFEIEEGAEE